eukprot:TRINITY_DN16629_c0_g1_i1.p2 TRINITY_DN16629_c0_g1~~TRINITY_DN16629_c0_g1_i1.p2  ORF type:complete len:135 (-),score=10.24 TRINITY_DN16629_c0_g1_i1:285-689(-)
MYIQQTPIKDHKAVWLALQAIKGVGRDTAKYLCGKLGVGYDVHMNQLTSKHLETLDSYLNNMTLGSQLDKKVCDDIQRLVRINTTRGWRHFEGYPVRGQRTITNAMTARRNPRRLGLMGPTYDLKMKDRKKKNS